MCYMGGQIKRDTSIANSGEELTMRWHRKLDHMSKKGLKILFD